MPLLPHKQQITINDERAIIEQIDTLTERFDLTRPEIYAIAIRKLLKDPAGVVAEIMADRIAAIKENA